MATRASTSNRQPRSSPKDSLGGQIANGWTRVLQIGDEVLPCSDICANTTGKFGLHKVLETKNDMEWKMIEEYYW